MKKLLAYLLTTLCVLCAAFGACADVTQTGTVMTSPNPYDITVILPGSMNPTGATGSFAYGYFDDSMLVGLTPMNYTDFDKLYADRFVEGFAEEKKLTINGMKARLYTPPSDYGIAAIYEVQSKAGSAILELAFYPRDMAAAKKNQACIEQVIGSLRARTDTMAEDFSAKWTSAFSHNSVGLAARLPGSMVKRAQRLSEDSVVEYQNDYITMLVFAYEGTLAEYVDEYNMNQNDFYRDDVTVNGVAVHVFEPKSADVSTDSAYVVAEGRNGTLLEIIFGANVLTEVDESWKYINRIVNSITWL